MSAPELYKNSASTTFLNGAINNSQTTLDVDDASIFPSGSGQYRILIDQEIMLVTGVASNTLTVARAQESTTAGSHNDNSVVVHLLTAGAIDQIFKDLVNSGAEASIPSWHRQGNLYLPTDGQYLYRDDGSAFQPYGPLYKFVKPISGDFSWVNQGGATVTQSNGGIVLTAPANAGHSMRIRTKSILTAPYKITAAFTFVMSASTSASAQCGLCLRNSSDSKVVGFYINQGELIQAAKWATETSSPTVYTVTTTTWRAPIVWFQIEDDNTNRLLKISPNGYDWFTLHTVGRTDFTTPNQMGFFSNSNNSQPVLLNLLHWKEN